MRMFRRSTPPHTPEPDPEAPVALVENLRHVYADGTAVDFGDVPLAVRPGERVVLLGPNGSGKSTLLLHVLGLLEPQKGSVRVFGRPAHTLPPEWRARVAALLQQVDEQIIGPTVWDDVAFSPRNLGLDRVDADRLVEGALRRLGIWELRHRVPHALSAGERRKVALAGAIVFSAGTRFGPRLLVLDEPFAALDPRSRAALLALIEELRHDHGTAVLLSTQFVHTVPEFADTVCVLAPGGRIAAHGAPEEVFARPEVLESLDIEPPVLSQLFRSLERRGISLPAPKSVEHAAELLAGHCRDGVCRLPDLSSGRRAQEEYG
ncbi:MAG: energy-coupling factor ABC transporter ATP-binding protein [Chloroflexi bacterium]|nr:energy-coupling factor ABC transporter ATP-binding protein [Chloroflexota bacterium]